MTQQWEFSSLAFLVLCDRYRSGSVPRPLLFETDEDVTVDEMDRRRRDMWESLQDRLDGSFDGVIEVMRAPEVYVQVRSWDEHDRSNKDKQLRVHIARSGALGYVFEQAPGKLTWDSPMVTVTECDPSDLGSKVVASLPSVAAGRLPDIPVVTDPAEHITPAWRDSLIWDDVDERPVAQTQRFFQQPADLTGAIAVVQGRSKYGPRGILETNLMWRDIPGDGRYVMSLDESPVAVATGPRELAVRIQRDIDQLLERLETHWESGRPEDRY
ncbi:ESX secretion-associated protein EspG [Nocardia mexicana]|uniref:ESAT-6 protein secretion system EspG family protein n=1 Tax=Nocardia mexicana TaxID=279262 RepID=A0A370GMQ8_9NOCA|nr:ESX secretion-associated protein EspG [Nocardia mexicana]RDI45015.1 ESAT-6 protein secretion system EspG family protein [Nocardia mexicana]